MSKTEETQLEVSDSFIKSGASKKFLGVKINSKFSFDEHFKRICLEANSKLRALARNAPYMGQGIQEWIN